MATSANGTTRSDRIDEIYRRMEELRLEYSKYSEVLHKMDRKKRKESAEEEGRPQRNKRGPKRVVDMVKDAARDDEPLLMVMRLFIRKQGGSCHFDDILRHLSATWVEHGLALTEKDVLDRAHALLNDSDDADDDELFLKNPFKEGEYMVAPALAARLDCVDENYGMSDAIRSRRKDKSAKEKDDERAEVMVAFDVSQMAEIMKKGIKDAGGSASLDDVQYFVLKHWGRRSRVSEGRSISYEDVQNAIRCTLASDSSFIKDKEGVLRVEGMEDTRRLQRLNERPSRTRKRRRFDSESEDERPPDSFVCQCGVDTSDKRVRWERIGEGKDDWACKVCAAEAEKGASAACAVCGKEEHPDRNVEWICCDRCEKWVHSRCDGISDTSLYDDDNPNHKTYFCPDCRNRRTNERALKKKRGGGKGGGAAGVRASRRGSSQA